MRSVDTLIIGAGPGGLAAAIETSRRRSAETVLIVEKGRTTKLRLCPVDFARQCRGCGGTCNVLSGFGGCIHHGDGVKLSLLPSGRRLYDVLGSRADLLMNQARDIVEQALGRSLEFFLPPGDDAVDPNIRFKPYPVAVLSAADVRVFLDALFCTATSSPNVELQMGTSVTSIEPGTPHIISLQSSRGGKTEKVQAKNVIVAVGRAGLLWWHTELRRLGIDHVEPIPSVGLRFELNHKWLAGAAARHPDYKVTLKSEGRKFKSFCYCAGSGGGRIKLNDYGEFCLLDGHVVSAGDVEITDRTPGNFALLHQETDVPNGLDPLTHMVRKYVDPYRRLRPDRPGKPVAQLYSDFAARTSSVQSWAALASRLEHAPSVHDMSAARVDSLFDLGTHAGFCEAVERFLSQVCRFSPATPQEVSQQMLVVALELEGMWDAVSVDTNSQTNIPRLYAVGDAMGVAQGILQAMTTGISAAQHIAQ